MSVIEPAQDDAPHYQDFILLRELAEVYLLLDNLSGSASKDLEDKDVDTPKFVSTRGAKDWISAVCEIAWPPSGTTEDEALDIATLIRVRDYLNRRAAPANGSTIAFTLLVTGEGDDKRRASNQPRLPTGVRGWRGREPPSRVELANLAFPNLDKRAREFKTWIFSIAIGLFVVLAWTCFLSWDVGAGNALLAQFSADQADVAQVESQIADAQTGGNSDQPASQTPAPAEDGAAASATAKQPVIKYCDRPAYRAAVAQATADATAKATAKFEQFDSAIQLRLCEDLRKKTSALNAAGANLANWARPWSLVGVQPCTASGAPCSTQDSVSFTQAATQQWASSLLGVLSGGVLPIFYGFLGAGAAVVRNLSAKMRDWQLAPRDLLICLIQLALGAVIGACIGLFVTPAGASAGAGAGTGSDAASAQGLLGPVHLSASALCFIAGFFVEGVFTALEGFARRVFNITNSETKPLTRP